MRRVFGYLKTYRLRMCLGLFIKVVGTLMDLVIPYILAYIVDEAIPLAKLDNGEVSKEGIIRIIIFGVIMIFCSFVGVFGNVIANRMAALVARNVTTDLRHDLFWKIENLSSNQTDEVGVPSLISRMTNDTYNIHQFVGMSQRIGVRAPILLIGGIIVTLTLDPMLTLVLLCTLPLIIVTIYFITKSGLPLYTKVQQAIDNMVRTIRENITGIRVIKALSKGDYENKRFSKVNKEVFDYEINVGTSMARTGPLINLFLNIGLVVVILVGAFRVNSDLTKAGKIIAFISYFTIISNAMVTITRIFVMYSRAAASSKRFEYIMDLPIDLNVKDEANSTNNYHIEFKDVDFAYGSGDLALTNINFALKKGESLGIIGATGSGKTTIINLLMRYYDCNKGNIYINKTNVVNYEKETLQKMFGVVFQNDVLFSDTIEENVLFGRSASKEEVKKALIAAQAWDFVNSLENGVETVVAARGQNLSGGQKQRILIARALLNNPDILILDDSSSALDYKTDANLRKAIKDKFDNTTTIIVSQRISSIMNCDKIIVIDEGMIVGYGTNDELLKSVDIYKDIYNLQMGGSR